MQKSQKVSAFLGSAALAATVAGSSAASAGSLDPFEAPPLTDPSAYTSQPTDVKKALQELLTLPETNKGSYELSGGEYSGRFEQREGNALPPEQQSLFNYPTNGYPSPMFGAQPWTQKLLIFEEFGLRPLDNVERPYSLPFPQPRTGSGPELDSDDVARTGPDGDELDAFLRQEGLWPVPTRLSNTYGANPWKYQVEQFLDRYLASAPAEGRPPGEGWAHQRWNEFFPQAYFTTAQAGARANRGTRDTLQLHGFSKGEFGPGGLYYSSSGSGPGGSNRDVAPRFHPNLPIQEGNTLWTFDGTFPPKLLMARYGQPILMRHYNALPIDPGANRGFGLHTISTHEHNGHNPAESDGFANAFFFPGQFYDYRWPMQLAGYDTINTTASEPRAAFPCGDGETLWVNDGKPNPKVCKNGKINIRGDWRETMSTHWFHDHMLDFTALPL
jgi:manganese oxidase